MDSLVLVLIGVATGLCWAPVIYKIRKHSAEDKARYRQ